MSIVHKIAKLHSLSRNLWIKACAHDGVPLDSKFVEFSRGNPYSNPAGRAALLFNRTMAQAAGRI